MSNAQERLIEKKAGKIAKLLPRQVPLRMLYKMSPKKAWVTDTAITSSDRVAADQPLYGHVTFGKGIASEQPIALHKAVGGRSDLPVPGDLLAAAVASCLDSTTRAVANLFRIKLKKLSIDVCLGVDIRGTLRMDKTVPVGFQKADIKVDIDAEGDIPRQKIEKLIASAEKSCVVIQSLKIKPNIEIRGAANAGS